MRYHFIRGCLEEGSIKASYINTKDQLADLLTKPLGRISLMCWLVFVGLAAAYGGCRSLWLSISLTACKDSN